MEKLTHKEKKEFKEGYEEWAQMYPQEPTEEEVEKEFQWYVKTHPEEFIILEINGNKQEREKIKKSLKIRDD